MTDSRLTYWLLLEMIFGIGNKRLYELRKRERDPKALYLSLHDPDNGILSKKEYEQLRKLTLEHAENIIAMCEKAQIRIMTIDDESYPDTLRNIYNSPMVLFYQGNLALLHSESILTVVGARRASQYSLRAAERFCKELSKYNVIIASGGAVGIDAAAHWASLHAGKPTISVMGCGLDYDYPRENAEMRRQIVEKGLLLSEYFPGMSPYPSNFPARNRILANISEGTFVVEASSKSGAMNTANFACDNGKQVFCLPPSDVFDSRYQGQIRLLRDGALPAFNERDILQELYRSYPHRLVYYDVFSVEDTLLYEEEQEEKAVTSGKKKLAKKKSVKAELPEQPAEPAVTAERKQPEDTLPDEVTPDQQRILELLKKGGQNVNAICYLLDIPFEETSMLLMEMEMNGWIVNTERDMFALPG